jgi:starch phosphorylase
LPEGWLAMMRASMSTVAPDFSFDRMLKEYVSKFYLPAGVLGRRVDGPSYAGARALAAWEARVRAGWDQVSLTAAGPISGEMSVGKPLEVRATLQPGPLSPGDLAVELVFGQMADDDLSAATVIPMRPLGGAGAHAYVAAFDSPESGVFSYGVRVRPHHADLPNPFALGLVRWA